MKRKAAKITNKNTRHSPHFYIIFATVIFIIGIFAAIIFTKVLAETDSITINACVNKTNGNVRIVDDIKKSSCKNNEYELTWNKEGIQGPPGSPGNPAPTVTISTGLPYHCYNCRLWPFADKFRGKDFSNSEIMNSLFTGADLTGVILKGALLTGVNFNNANLTGADFSDLAREYIATAPEGSNIYSQNLYFTNANLTDSTFAGSILQKFDFTGANLQNANFSNTTIRLSKFTGATGMSTANIDGATWIDTYCPDGSYSNANNNTCAGHF